MIVHDLVIDRRACAAASRRSGRTCNNRVGAREFVIEAETIEKSAQPRVVGRAEGRIFVRKRVRNRGSAAGRDGRRASPCSAHCRAPCAARPCRRKRREAGLDPILRQDAKGVAHHGRARDLAEGADMRQPGRTVAGLENDFGLRPERDSLDEPARFLEWPGVGVVRALKDRRRDLGEAGVASAGHGAKGRRTALVSLKWRRVAAQSAGQILAARLRAIRQAALETCGTSRLSAAGMALRQPDAARRQCVAGLARRRSRQDAASELRGGEALACCRMIRRNSYGYRVRPSAGRSSPRCASSPDREARRRR